MILILIAIVFFAHPFRDPLDEPFIEQQLNLLKPNTLRNRRLTPMRNQTSYRSDTIPEFQISIDGSTSYPETPIKVIGIPTDAIIHQVALTWEGRFRNANSVINFASSGVIELRADGTGANQFLNISSKTKLNPNHSSPVKIKENDVRVAFLGNATYKARFFNLLCQVPLLFITGNWLLEVDYETI